MVASAGFDEQVTRAGEADPLQGLYEAAAYAQRALEAQRAEEVYRCFDRFREHSAKTYEVIAHTYPEDHFEMLSDDMGRPGSLLDASQEVTHRPDPLGENRKSVLRASIAAIFIDIEKIIRKEKIENDFISDINKLIKKIKTNYQKTELVRTYGVAIAIVGLDLGLRPPRHREEEARAWSHHDIFVHDQIVQNVNQHNEFMKENIINMLLSIIKEEDPLKLSEKEAEILNFASDNPMVWTQVALDDMLPISLRALAARFYAFSVGVALMAKEEDFSYVFKLAKHPRPIIREGVAIGLGEAGCFEQLRALFAGEQDRRVVDAVGELLGEDLR